ncbi:MAG: glycosyltransferase family 9 protein [Deltaproteobacteria bacterium]|nr:glycosyltransferase family 9 protein [Deltaproteobacteria bacterium]
MKPGGILVLHQGALGDWILSIPAFRSIRQHHPNQIARMAIHSFLIPLLKCSDRSYEGISNDDGRILDLWRENERPPGRIGTLGAAYVFGRKRDPVLFKNLGRICGEEPKFLPTFPQPHTSVHVVEFQGRVLQTLNLRAAGPMSRLHPPEEALREARSALRRLGVGESPIAVHPGSGSKIKNWSIQCFKKLIRYVSSNLTVPVVLLLGPADEDLVPETAGLPCLTGLPLDTLAAVLKISRGYIGNDSGVTHLAAATGTPTLALFGPTDPHVWGPIGEHVSILRDGPQMEDLAYESVRMRAEAFFFDRPHR